MCNPLLRESVVEVSQAVRRREIRPIIGQNQKFVDVWCGSSPIELEDIRSHIEFEGAFPKPFLRIRIPSASDATGCRFTDQLVADTQFTWARIGSSVAHIQ